MKKMVVLLVMFASTIIFESYLLAKWGIETVDSFSENYYNWCLSMSLDGDDNPHICYDYRGKDEYILYYAKWTGTNWQKELICKKQISRGNYYSNDIKIGSDNLPQICYYDPGQYVLKYQKWDGTSWKVQTVDNEEIHGNVAFSMALDKKNYPHIAYRGRDSQGRYLRYARWDGNKWDIEIIGNKYYPERISIVVDKNDKPHIAYGTHDEKEGERLNYAWIGETWHIDDNIDDIYGAIVKPESVSIAIDQDNIPSISFINWDGRQYNLKIAKNKNNFWDIQKVISCGSSGSSFDDRGASLAIDANGYSHIFYLTYSPDKDVPVLSYVKWTGTEWLDQTVDSTSVFGLFSNSIVLDKNDNPRFAYAGILNNHSSVQYVKFLTNEPELAWVGTGKYISDGADPDSGDIETLFTFKIKYIDKDGDKPLPGYPKVHILNNGENIPGSPFSMFLDGSSTFDSGATYYFTTKLDAGNYTYKFEAYDTFSAAAFGVTQDLSPLSVGNISIPENSVYTIPNPARSGNLKFRFYCGFDYPTFDIKIYDIKGELVKTIRNEDITISGNRDYEYLWDCRNDDGQKLASGILIYILTAKDMLSGEEKKISKKLAIVK